MSHSSHSSHSSSAGRRTVTRTHLVVSCPSVAPFRSIRQQHRNPPRWASHNRPRAPSPPHSQYHGPSRRRTSAPNRTVEYTLPQYSAVRPSPADTHPSPLFVSQQSHHPRHLVARAYTVTYAS